MKHLTENTLKMLKSKTYVTTRAHHRGKELLDNLGLVILVGSSGTGKTTLGLHLMAHIRDIKNRQVLMLDYPSQFEDVHIPKNLMDVTEEEKLVILIDDIFGRSNFVHEYLQKWEKTFSRLWDIVKTGFIKVILTCRLQIFCECENSLNQFDVFKRCHQINLHNPEFCLTIEEKLSILDQHLKSSTSKDLNSTLSNSDKEMIAESTSSELGFPQCCSFFVNSPEAQKRGVNYFKNPIEYLKVELCNIKENKQCHFQYLVLLIIMFKQGTLDEKCIDPFENDRDLLNLITILKDVCRINTDVSLGEIKASAKSLCGIYLAFEESNKQYTFIHQSVFDTLFLLFSSEFLHKSIQICPVPMLLEYVVTPHVQIKGSINVLVEKENYRSLAERFTNELKGTHVDDDDTKSEIIRTLFLHPSFKDEYFMKFLTEEFWNNEVPTEILCQKCNASKYIRVRFSQNVIDNLWKIVENGKHDDLDLLDIIDYNIIIPEQPIYKICTFSSPGSMAVLENIKTLSRCFLSSLCKINTSETEHIKKGIFDIACFVGNTEVIDILLNSGIFPTMCSFTAAVASQTDDLDIFTNLFKLKNDLKLNLQDLESMLFLALEQENGKISSFLIDEIIGMDNSHIILENAAKQLLLQCHRGVWNLWHIYFSKSSFKMRAGNLFRKLSSYTQSLKLEVLVALTTDLDAGAVLKEIIGTNPSCLDTMKCKVDPLLTTSRNGCIESVAFLIEQGCNISAVNQKQYTSLHLAVKYNTCDVVLCLLSNGADPNAQDIDGNSPLHLAVQQGQLCLIKALVKHGAKFNIANKLGETSLHIASENCSLELIKYLVEGGAQVNSPNTCGRIPLHLAAIYNYSADCVQYLVEKGSKVNWPDDEGLTPLLLASGTGVASSLLSKGADHLVTDVMKNTALHRAVNVESKVDSLDLAKLFVTKGVKMNAVNADGDTPVHIALKNNKSQIVTYLVDQGCLINMTGEDMTTLLHLALNGGFVELVKTLIQKGANLNTTDGLEMNPLHIAIKNTDNTIMFVKYLVGHGSSVNRKNSGSAPLHLALTVKKFDVCLYLLNEGADPKGTDNKQNTPLHLAAHNNSVDVLKTLLEKGAIVNAVNIIGRTPLHMATEEGSLELTKTLVQNGANLNKTDNYGWTPLLNAIKNKYNSSRVLDYLMECIKKQSVNWEDSNLMHLSFQNNMHQDMHLDIVNLKIKITQRHLALIDNKLDLCSYLLHRGADPNASDTEQNSPLHLAVHEKSQDVVETLIENGAIVNAVNSIGKTALHIATEGYSLVESLTIEGLGPTLNLPDFATIKILIEKGAKLNVVDVSGNTPLHNVAQYSPVDVVRYLVEKGSQIHLPNDNGMMPIHLAVQYNTSDVCFYLLQKGADPNVEDANGNSPLYLAIYNRYLNLVEALLEHGVHLNKLDDDGNTPLHVAAKTSSLEIVSFLIEMGSETNLSNDNDMLPFHLAVKHNTEDVALYLLDKTTNPNLVGNTELDSPLHMAAKKHSLNLVKALVERRANVNEVNEFGEIPLHSIIQSFAGPKFRLKIHNYKTLSKEITGSLTLPLNRAVNTVDSDDRTPCQILASYSVEGVKYLVESGSHINTSDGRGRTPLHEALTFLFPDVSVYLLENGADPCVKDENETPPLHLAANNNHCSLQLLKTLFKKGANLNSTDPFGNTPLHIAVEQNSIECVGYLVEKGSQINKANNSGIVPLHIAVGLSDSTIGLYLLSKGADPKITSAEKMSPLHLAARTNHSDLVSALVIKGADLNAVDNSGETALHKAVCCKQLKVVHYLVEEGSLINVTNSFGRTALHLAALHDGRSNVGVYLLSKGSEPNVSDSIMTTPLHLAVHTNTLDLIKALVENGANPNAVDQSSNTPLHIAVQYSPLETVSCLVEKGSKINLSNNDGMTPIHLAAQHTTPDIGLYLLDKGANVNVRGIKGKSPLHIAVHESKVDLVKALVENKAKLNTVDTFGNTPLHIAAHHSTLEIVRSLVDKGSEVNLKNSSNMLPLNLAVEHNTSEDVSVYLLNKMCHTNLQDTVWMDSLLHLAAKQCYLDLAKALVDKGANVNAHGESGKTTLHIAVENKSLEFVKYLVEKEVKVNAANEFKFTPLHIAVLNNSLELVTCLTENTADVNVRTRENMTPLYIAVKQNHYDISLLLLLKGADPNIRDNTINVSPLHLAAKALSCELLKALVEKKANVNDTDINGNIPLHTIIDGSVKATYSTAHYTDTNSELLPDGTAYYTDTNSELLPDGTTCLLNSTLDSQDSTQELPKEMPGNALKCVRYLVKNNSDVNIANAIGATPLHLAVKHNMFLVTSHLLSKGADPNVNDKHNMSPLHLAAEKCCSHVLEELVGKGANVNARDMLGNTPLHIGVKSNSTHAVMYLVENGSKINLKNNQNLTPLHLATRLKTPYLAIYLLGKGADPNVNDDDEISPLHLAVDADFLDLVKALVERGARQTTVDSHGHTPFQRAAYHGSFEILCYLGEKDCRTDSPDILGRTPLHLAACGRRIHHPASFDKRVIRWLLDAGCGLNSEDNHGYTPLIYACASGNNGTVEQLLEYGANPSHRNYIALYIAVCCYISDILKCLLNKGGNVKAVSDSGDTLLHVAVRRRQNILYSKLLPFIFGSAPIEYWTLLIHTLLNYNMEGTTWATELLSYNFPFPQKLPSYTCNFQRENVIEILLNNGCNINAKNKKGQTALHVCIECCMQQHLVELLNRGADVSPVDNLGKSALYYAVSSVMPDAVQILLQFGAKDGETSYGVTACEKARVKMQYSDENVKAKCSMIIDILDSSK